jgi:hypothetical protein
MNEMEKYRPRTMYDIDYGEKPVRRMGDFVNAVLLIVVIATGAVAWNDHATLAGLSAQMTDIHNELQRADCRLN